MEICQKERQGLNIEGVFCKNLFVRDKKRVFYLISALEDAVVDLKSLRKDLGANRCLTFSSEEELSEKLQVQPGGVTPFAAINCEGSADVKIVLDKGILKAPLANFHPLENQSTLTLAPSDLLLFLNDCGLEVILHEFERKPSSPPPPSSLPSSPAPSSPILSPAPSISPALSASSSSPAFLDLSSSNWTSPPLAAVEQGLGSLSL